MRYLFLFGLLITLVTISSSQVFAFGSGGGGALPPTSSTKQVAPTDAPTATTQTTNQLKCGNKTSLHDRIICRLALTPEEMTQELNIQYLPEECRAMANKSDQQTCVNRYISYRPCWNIPEGESRFDCARKALQLGADINQDVTNCNAAPNKLTCLNDLKTKVYGLIKFRFYNLDERAETLLSQGANINDVADLETTIETKKQEFNQATTTSQRKQIILDVRNAWNDFVAKEKNIIQ